MRRNTQQRRAILSALELAQGPLTAQEVLDVASQELDSLGIATVYRNLASLEEHEEIVAVHLPNDMVRYEPAGRGHHHHFHCTNCEQVFELTAKCPVAILEGVTLPGGFKVQDHALTLYGACPNCQ